MEESLAALSLIGREEAAWQVDLEEVSTEDVVDLSVFYYEINLDRFLEGSPWTFNNHLLLFHRLREGEDPMDFLGQFLEYDTKSLNKGYRGYMRIRVQIDVRNLLMRKKKLILSNKELEFEWDLSVKTIPKRAMVVTSSWLGEKGKGPWFGEFKKLLGKGKEGEP
ncbi:hypothetical protein Gohar_018785, partial [Gossypium harknessii]|nr:hypothetical protein [Gossypium harknessii]